MPSLSDRVAARIASFSKRSQGDYLIIVEFEDGERVVDRKSYDVTDMSSTEFRKAVEYDAEDNAWYLDAYEGFPGTVRESRHDDIMLERLFDAKAAVTAVGYAAAEVGLDAGLTYEDIAAVTPRVFSSYYDFGKVAYKLLMNTRVIPDVLEEYFDFSRFGQHALEGEPARRLGLGGGMADDGKIYVFPLGDLGDTELHSV